MRAQGRWRLLALHLLPLVHWPCRKNSQTTDFGSTPGISGGCLMVALNISAISSAARFFSSSSRFFSAARCAAALASFELSCACLIVFWTNFWTLEDLFLFFRPKVASSAACARVGWRGLLPSNCAVLLPDRMVGRPWRPSPLIQKFNA